MIYLVDTISQSLDNGDYVIGLYLDFIKAFDTVNHAYTSIYSRLS